MKVGVTEALSSGDRGRAAGLKMGRLYLAALRRACRVTP